MSASNQTASVLGLPVHLRPDYVEALSSRLRSGDGTHVVTINAEMAMLAQENPELAEVIRQAELVIPDGAGVVWVLRSRGWTLRRCPGIELAAALVAQAAREGWTVCFYGGEPGVAQAAADHWQQQYPQLRMGGVWHGYLSPAEQQQCAEAIASRQPQLILVGLGVPRQEFWIRDHRSLAPGSIWVGVGGSFDIWSGRKERAPRWLCRLSLEWTWRLYQEPWRWRRMLALPQFAWAALTERSPARP